MSHTLGSCPTCENEITEQDEICSECGMDLAEFRKKLSSPSDIKPGPLATELEKAKIILKRDGALTENSFLISGKQAVIGRFDPGKGPIDIDLSRLQAAEVDYLSRHHAKIWCNELGQWFFKDLGSKNGSFFRSTPELKFERVTGEQQISEGYEIALGNVQFEFRIQLK